MEYKLDQDQRESLRSMGVNAMVLPVTEECATLKFTLEKVETDYTNAKSEVNNLNGKVRNLESVLDEMHKAADNRREIGKRIIILKKAQWAKFF